MKKIALFFVVYLVIGLLYQAFVFYRYTGLFQEFAATPPDIKGLFSGRMFIQLLLWPLIIFQILL